MTQLLLELLSEEIPAKMQLKAESDFKRDFKLLFDQNGIEYINIETFSTPRRITLLIDNVDTSIKIAAKEVRGPRVDANEKAIEGFLRSQNLTLQDLVEKETPKGKFYFSVTDETDIDAASVIKDIINQYISSYNWPKSMRWGVRKMRWIRPLQNILCIFDGKVLDVEFGDIKANNTTCGHRFLGDKNLKIKDFDDYRHKLRENFVILSHEERKKIIHDKINQITKFNNLKLKQDKELEDEVAGLVEYPVVLIGEIDKSFMDLPQEVLVTSMKSHQKYFSLLDNDDYLAPYFIVVANIKDNEDESILKGNQKVLTARLEDAKFFWESDKNTKLEARQDKLDSISFHAKLGSVLDKTHRITELAKFISVWIPHANLQNVERAASLCKTDLTTQMVGEFPELQGIMGSYYAYENGEEKEVVIAMKNHYKPAGLSDFTPTDPVSIAVSLADKIDTLVGMFSIKETPTGSKDPFALRRNALGIIRVILDNNLNIPTKILIDKAINLYPKSIYKSDIKLNPAKIFSDTVKGKLSKQKQQKKVSDQVFDFLLERLKIVIKDKNIEPTTTKAALVGSEEDDFVNLVGLSAVLQEFITSEKGQKLLSAYKRSHNIVNSAIKKDNDNYDSNVDKFLIEVEEEKKLYNVIIEKKPIIESAFKKCNYKLTVDEISKFADLVDSFLDNVIVNHENPAVKKNRLCLLNQFNKVVDRVGNLNYIK